jgi:hypothetical protein
LPERYRLVAKSHIRGVPKAAIPLCRSTTGAWRLFDFPVRFSYQTDSNKKLIDLQTLYLKWEVDKAGEKIRAEKEAKKAAILAEKAQRTLLSSFLNICFIPFRCRIY